jgi:hypothetical protein
MIKIIQTLSNIYVMFIPIIITIIIILFLSITDKSKINIIVWLISYLVFCSKDFPIYVYILIFGFYIKFYSNLFGWKL